MTVPLTNVALLGAAHRFCLDPKRWRDELAKAVLDEVEGELYRQLNVAVRRALLAPAADLGLAIEGLRELIHAIGAEAEARRSKQRVVEQAPLLRPANARMPYLDDGEPVAVEEE